MERVRRRRDGDVTLLLDCETPLELRHIDASDGHRVPYRRWRPSGEPQGTVVLLNGIMSHSGWFFPLVDPLTSAGLVVVGADRRGSGLDDVQRGDAPNAKAIVDDALAVIDAEHVLGTPLVLVGWCWGSVLALNLLRPLGDRLSGLVMVAPGLFPSAAVGEAAAKHEAEAEGAAPDEPAILTPIADTMFTSGPYLENFIRKDPRRLLRITPRFRGLMSNLSVGALARLRRLDTPLLVLLAEGDEATDNDAVRRALAAIDPSGVDIREIASGHAMQFDVPSFVTDAITAFARRLTP
jgi:acylglycerol lipase